MKTLTFAILGLFVGVIVGHFLWHGEAQRAMASGVSPVDRAAIDRLHHQDIDVTLTQEPKGLVELWDEDGIRIGPDGGVVVGKKAIEADNAKNRVTYPEFKVLKYAPDIEHFALAVADGWGVEAGTMSATFKLNGKDDPVSVQYKTMRVLKRQADGSWKFAVVELK